MVSAYVVAPPRIADVGRRSGHIRLEFQARPRHGGIAGKSHGIAVAALFRVARQYERALALVLLVQELVVVERPQRVKPGHVAPLALLPVYPPEVHALFFIRAQNIVEIRLHYLFVCERERYALFCGRVHTRPSGDFFVHILEKPHARGRVEIERDGIVHALQFFQHSPVIGEKVGIPAVSRPARPGRVVKQIEHPHRLAGLCLRSETLNDVHPMPVHIYGCHGKGQSFRLETAHKR